MENNVNAFAGERQSFFIPDVADKEPEIVGMAEFMEKVVLFAFIARKHPYLGGLKREHLPDELSADGTRPADYEYDFILYHGFGFMPDITTLVGKKKPAAPHRCGAKRPLGISRRSRYSPEK